MRKFCSLLASVRLFVCTSLALTVVTLSAQGAPATPEQVEQMKAACQHLRFGEGWLWDSHIEMGTHATAESLTRYMDAVETTIRNQRGGGGEQQHAYRKCVANVRMGQFQAPAQRPPTQQPAAPQVQPQAPTPQAAPAPPPATADGQARGATQDQVKQMKAVCRHLRRGQGYVWDIAHDQPAYATTIERATEVLKEIEEFELFRKHPALLAYLKCLAKARIAQFEGTTPQAPSKAPTQQVKADPKTSATIWVTRRAGNNCIEAKIGKVVKPAGSDGYEVEVLFTNTCKTAQLLYARIAHAPLPLNTYRSYPYHNTPIPTMNWHKPLPVDELGYAHALHGPAVAFGILAGDTARATTFRPKGESLHTNVQVGSCDLYDEKGFEQTAFVDAKAFEMEGFKCLPNRFSEHSRTFRTMRP